MRTRVTTGYSAVTFIRTRAEKGKTKRKVYTGSLALYEARKGRGKNDRVKERDETSAGCRQSAGVRRRREGIRGEQRRRRTRRRARSLPRPRPFPPPGGNHMLPGFMSASNPRVSLTGREGRTFPVSPSHPRPSRETARSALLLPAYPPRPIARLEPPPVPSATIIPVLHRALPLDAVLCASLGSPPVDSFVSPPGLRPAICLGCLRSFSTIFSLLFRGRFDGSNATSLTLLRSAFEGTCAHDYTPGSSLQHDSTPNCEGTTVIREGNHPWRMWPLVPSRQSRKIRFFSILYSRIFRYTIYDMYMIHCVVYS